MIAEHLFTGRVFLTPNPPINHIIFLCHTFSMDRICRSFLLFRLEFYLLTIQEGGTRSLPGLAEDCGNDEKGSTSPGAKAEKSQQSFLFIKN